MGLILTVAIDVGTAPTKAALELSELAEKLCVVVQGVADLQGNVMSARPGETSGEVLRAYNRDCRLAEYPID